MIILDPKDLSVFWKDKQGQPPDASDFDPLAWMLDDETVPVSRPAYQKVKCDCGVASVHGEDYPAERHSLWCSLQDKNQNVMDPLDFPEW